MKRGVLFLLFIICIQRIVGPPITKNKQPETVSASTSEDVKESEPIEQYMEYHRYLKEVVQALESDLEFKKKLEQADEADIRSGKIADQLEFVSHHVRTRLDEIKRTEMERLRELVQKKQDLAEGNTIEDPNHGHLDHLNPHTFEIEDLKKLIVKTTEDLAEADRKRREEFKRYEMQKEIEKMEKLNQTTGEEKEKLEKQYKELEEKHKKHERLHEPGHKAQLEEVWEKQDHMEQDFDPKTFFMFHDLDSNGLWDENEVKALFIKELDKMYAAGAPEDDMRERVEEMERMRETVFRDVDKNHDGFIDYTEFISQTKNPDFQEDHGWQGLDEDKPYTDEELQEYIHQYQMQHHPPYAGYNQGGYYQVPPNHVPPSGYSNQVSPQVYNQVPPQGYQVPPQGHPNQPSPQGYPNQVPPQRYPNQAPPQGYPNQGHPNQVPPQDSPNQVLQDNPNQIPQGNPNQIPPHGYQNQIPAQESSNQIPPQGHPNRAPHQVYSNQVPQGNRNQIPQDNPNHIPPQDNPNHISPQGNPQIQSNQVDPQVPSGSIQNQAVPHQAVSPKQGSNIETNDIYAYQQTKEVKAQPPNQQHQNNPNAV